MSFLGPKKLSKYSDLIVLRKRIEALRMEDFHDEITKRLYDVAIIRDDIGKTDGDFQWLDGALGDISNSSGAIQTMLKMRLDEIDVDMREIMTQHFESDTEYWDSPGAKFKTAEYIRTYQKLKVTKDTEEVIKARIGIYTDWKHAAIEIGPGDGKWTRNLVACDPLYLVDYNDEFLEATKNTFTEKYQRRLRCYLNNGNGLHMLPREQFGFVFSWNTFNYFNFPQIQNWLNDIDRVLKPGGACMFSFNNVERVYSAIRAEEQLMSFIPGHVLKLTIEAMGFVDVKITDADTAVSWVEFRKRGELKSKRAGQTLGKIILAKRVKA